MCSFEPRNKSSSGAWMVAANDVPLVADYVGGTSSLIKHLVKGLPASHPLVSSARRHIEQGKIILDVSLRSSPGLGWFNVLFLLPSFLIIVAPANSSASRKDASVLNTSPPLSSTRRTCARTKPSLPTSPP